MDISLNDVAIAYRKAKADLYYSSVPCRARIVQFENDLDRNLKVVYDVLKSCDIDRALEFCHGYIIVPKRVKFLEISPKIDKKKGVVVYSSPSKNADINDVDVAEFRIMADLPIEFHVIMTWWILNIGERYERLISDDSYGNRIRRRRDGAVNRFSIGTFSKYLSQYRTWRDRGIAAIRKTVEEGEDVVAVTADFVSFYHKINPSFLSSREFYERLGVDKVSEEELRYTNLVVEMLKQWARATPIQQGLPVGCSISAVIANLALANFDYEIQKNLAPVYYGRYVDDIIIVMRNTNDFQKASDVWNWISKRIDALEAKRTDHICYIDKVIGSVAQTALSFERSKTKVFLVDHNSGSLLVDTIEEQIKSRSSEWRSLPDIPLDDRKMASKILTACNTAGEIVDNLRKVDSVSLKRAVFAMTVRDFEAYGRNLNPEAWAQTRLSFIKMIDEHFTDISSFFDLYGYLPRIMACACSCNGVKDESTLSVITSIVSKILKIAASMMSVPTALKLAGATASTSFNISNALQSFFIRLFGESFVSAIEDSSDLGVLFGRLHAIDQSFSTIECELSYSALVRSDLATKPSKLLQVEPIARLKAIEDGNWWRSISEMYAQLIGERELQGAPLSMLFPTRPLNAYDLTEEGLNPYLDEKKRKVIEKFLRYSRGYGISSELCAFPDWDRAKNYVSVPWTGQHKSVHVALANWLTTNESYEASMRQIANIGEGERYNRLMRLVNEIISSGVRVDYLIFPELSIPSQWFKQIALKLKNSKISLIAGVEYLHETGSNKVRNQVWCSLLFDGCGFTDVVVYKFEKARPAIHEASHLLSSCGKSMTSSVLENPKRFDLDKRPIVLHGNAKGLHFDFSAITCSDLTNIDYRAQLRGKVDAIFVPAWNQDEDVFASLVESAAYDVHAFIVECNNREFSDTRIRVPAKEKHARDLVRIKGGLRDYFVIGKIDFESLRRFQDNAISPTGGSALYKPVPSGFKMAEWRKLKSV